MSGILSWSLCSRTVFRPFFSPTTTEFRNNSSAPDSHVQ